MAGDGTKVGEVYVEIKATGADNVAKEVQKAQQMAAAPGGFTSMPAWAGSAGANSTMVGGGGPAAIKETTAAVKEQAAAVAGPMTDAVNKADAATKKYAESKKSLRQEVVALRQNLLGTFGVIGAFAGAIGTVVSGFINARNAGAALNTELKNLESTSKIKLDFGLSQAEESLRTARAEISKNRDAVNEANTGTEAFGQRMIAALSTANNAGQIATGTFTALKTIYEEANGTFADTLDTTIKKLELDNEELNVVNRIIAAEKNRTELMKEQASVREATKYLSDFNKEADATIAAQRKVELAELEGVARIRKQRDFDIEDLQKKKWATDDADIRRLLDMQIKSREELADAEIRIAKKSEDEKEQLKKDAADRALEQAKKAAETQAKAISEAYSKATENIMANFANAQSQSIEELGQYVKLIAEGVGR